MALILPTSGGHSVGIVSLRAKVTDFSFLLHTPNTERITSKLGYILKHCSYDVCLKLWDSNDLPDEVMT
jgi:hypothetical protein